MDSSILIYSAVALLVGILLVTFAPKSSDNSKKTQRNLQLTIGIFLMVISSFGFIYEFYFTKKGTYIKTAKKPDLRFYTGGPNDVNTGFEEYAESFEGGAKRNWRELIE